MKKVSTKAPAKRMTASWMTAKKTAANRIARKKRLRSYLQNLISRKNQCRRRENYLDRSRSCLAEFSFLQLKLQPLR